MESEEGRVKSEEWRVKSEEWRVKNGRRGSRGEDRQGNRRGRNPPTNRRDDDKFAHWHAIGLIGTNIEYWISKIEDC